MGRGRETISARETANRNLRAGARIWKRRRVRENTGDSHRLCEFVVEATSHVSTTPMIVVHEDFERWHSKVERILEGTWRWGIPCRLKQCFWQRDAHVEDRPVDVFLETPRDPKKDYVVYDKMARADRRTGKEE